MKWKMVALIVSGVLVSLFTMSILQRYDILYWDVYLFVAISFYPLAFVYGRRVMVDVFYSIKVGPYKPFSTASTNGFVRTFCQALNWIVAAFIFAFVKICQAAYLFSEGRTSEGKNAIIGAFIAGGASIITGYLFKLWGVNPLSGI